MTIPTLEQAIELSIKNSLYVECIDTNYKNWRINYIKFFVSKEYYSWLRDNIQYQKEGNKSKPFPELREKRIIDEYLVSHSHIINIEQLDETKLYTEIHNL